MEMTVIHMGETESGKALHVGDKVTYLAHVPGGMVRVRLSDGTIDIAHPACFDALA